MLSTIVLYDGKCGFCNKSVALILKNRCSNNYTFAALQSNYAKSILKDECIDFSTVYVIKEKLRFIKSDAAFEIIKDFKWYWKLLLIFKIIPLKWRNKLYDFIAKRRHKIASNYCYTPSNLERKMFKN